jgi:Cu/Ag efflux protein CusF
MRELTTAFALVLALSAGAFAATALQGKPAKAAARATVASHSTSGIIKSIDSNTLVITHRGIKDREMTFALNSSTQRDPSIGVGSRVTVRYQTEGKSMVATAVTARPAKQSSANKPAPKK